MLEQDSDDPAALRAAVTSPGGTTQAAISLLDRERVSEHVRAAVLAARDRGRELAG
jgi:pyrroline-5-carboxylate reductase